MKENGLKSKVVKKYKATTNSNHNLPVAENILNRDFNAEKPNQKRVSDITYIATDEGWLYLAGSKFLLGFVVLFLFGLLLMFIKIGGAIDEIYNSN